MLMVSPGRACWSVAMLRAGMVFPAAAPPALMVAVLLGLLEFLAIMACQVM